MYLNRKEFCIAESFDPSFDYKEKIVIALTPEACYHLDKAGIAHSTLADYCSRSDIRARYGDDYFLSQLEWFDALDAYLERHVEILKNYQLRLARRYYYILKYWVDSVFYRAHELKDLLERTKPSAITFISSKSDKGTTKHYWPYGNTSLSKYILPVLCNDYSIPFTFRSVEGDFKKKYETVQCGNTWQRLKMALLKNALVKKTHYMYKNGLLRPFWRTSGQSGMLTFVMANNGWQGESEFIREAMRNGNRIFLLRGKDIIKTSAFSMKKHRQTKAAKGRSKDKEELDRAADCLTKEKSLAEWLDRWCCMSISGIILPRIQYFIREICHEIITHARYLAGFYDEEKVDFVMLPGEGILEDYAAIAACKLSRNTKSVHIQHGDSIFVNRWGITELEHFDYYFASDKEFASYFEKEKRSPLKYMKDCECKIYSCSNRFRIIKDLASKKKTKKYHRKNKIVYLPTVFRGDFYHLDFYRDSDAEYYKFQKELIEYFASKKEFFFLWKGLTQADAVYNPIPDFIRDGKYSNIGVSTVLFQWLLGETDRVIIDHPSTGFYEALLAGIPTLALCHDLSSPRESALKAFDKNIRRFSGARDAIEKIEDFLAADPDKYVSEIPISKDSMFETLVSNAIKGL